MAKDKTIQIDGKKYKEVDDNICKHDWEDIVEVSTANMGDKVFIIQCKKCKAIGVKEPEKKDTLFG